MADSSAPAKTAATGKFKPSRYVLVGCGGVGTYLAPLFRYLSHAEPGADFMLVDGDIYEPKNLTRQDVDKTAVDNFENKAVAKAREFGARFPELNIVAVPYYVDTHNIDAIIPEGSIVFSAVDNHKSRLMISDHMSKLNKGILISGGNDYTDGNVQVHVRLDGQHVTPPITYLHPEIEFPEDKHPGEVSCEEKAATTTPQIIFANVEVATKMLSTYWATMTAIDAGKDGKVDIPYTEVYFDMATGGSRAQKRKRIMQDGAEASAERTIDVSDGRTGPVGPEAGRERKD